MNYVTFYKTKDPYRNATMFDWLDGTVTLNMPEEHMKVTNVLDDIEWSKKWAEKNIFPLFSIPMPPKDLDRSYSSFKIPKKSGGLRQIDAPNDELKTYLTTLKSYLENTLKILPHNAAHAYVQSRSTVTAIQQHQKNNSKWFLKLDLKDFFGSHNIEYIMNTLSEIHPMSYLLTIDEYKEKIKECLECGMLNDKLPQGTPLSPTLTNILMVGIDYDIQKYLWSLNNNFCYTRYADDLLISSPRTFDYKEIEKEIIKIMKKHNAPFKLNRKKTRYGSSSGSNWNLGVMLNKDNNITVGYRNNQRIRAMIFNVMKDYENHKFWSEEDKAHLRGLISYYKMIEPEYINHVIVTYQQKFKVSLKDILK